MRRKGKMDANLKEVSRSISQRVQNLLWGCAAGRCQFKGCNKPVWKSGVTQEIVNIAEKAHIYAFSSNGPRGNSKISSSQLNEFSNLLLVCHDCHKTIDQGDGANYSVELLRKWKLDHENRVETVTGINPNHCSHVLLFGANIGDVQSVLQFEHASNALFPRKFPAETRAIELQTRSSELKDSEKDFWRTEDANLSMRFRRRVGERICDGEIQHLSVFGLAPMPLLIRLGTLLTDIPEVDVFQYHRHPKGWNWPSDTENTRFIVKRPDNSDKPPVLVVSLSATVPEHRVISTLGKNVSIWELSVSNPDQECIRSQQDLAAFSSTARRVLNEIQANHSEHRELAIFPAAPVSTMVELGRVRQPKAAQNWKLFDYQASKAGFIHAMDITTDS